MCPCASKLLIRVCDYVQDVLNATLHVDIAGLSDVIVKYIYLLIYVKLFVTTQIC